MFSGIVQSVGKVHNISTSQNVKTFDIEFAESSKCSIGDSVAINGVCLTVTKFNTEHNLASFDAVPETLEKTNLSELKESDNVNTEIAIRYGDVVGGHMMQGHVDETGYVKEIKDVGGAWLVEINASAEFLKYLVKKGFVSIDGMSITVVDVMADSFSITLIPHTIDQTIAKNYTLGASLNLEADATGKYIYKYVKELKNV